MWNRAKQILNYCMDALLALILLAGCVAYIGINTVLMTSVINDLRLDTYMTHDTGLSIVLLVLLLGWAPVWLIRSFRDRR